MRFSGRTLKTLGLCFFLVPLLSAAIGVQETPSPAGHWEGAILTPQGDLPINVDLKLGEDGVWTGDISIPAQMAEDLPLADVKVDGKSVSFRMVDVPGDPTFAGTLSDDGKTIAGPYTQGTGEFEFRLMRSDP